MTAPIEKTFQGLFTATQDVPYSTALKQGTGINPIHSYRDQSGRNLANDPPNRFVDQSLVDAAYDETQYGYTFEDGVHQWTPGESGYETGMYDHPPVGDNSPDNRRVVPQAWPSYGPGPNGTPKGSLIRSLMRGAVANQKPNQLPTETVSEGWINKATGQVIDPGSGISDPDQYTRQTSMQQLRRTRAGSQISGTADDHTQPIATRVPGQKVYFFSGGQRHYDMMPKAQDSILRPFRVRTAGTADPNLMSPNAMYRSEPLQRNAPGDPYQGPTVPDQGTDFGSEYGYTLEDQVW